MNSFKHLSNPEQSLLSPEISRVIQETRQDLKFDFTSLYLQPWFGTLNSLQFVELCVWYFELFSHLQAGLKNIGLLLSIKALTFYIVIIN